MLWSLLCFFFNSSFLLLAASALVCSSLSRFLIPSLLVRVLPPVYISLSMLPLVVLFRLVLEYFLKCFPRSCFLAPPIAFVSFWALLSVFSCFPSLFRLSHSPSRLLLSSPFCCPCSVVAVDWLGSHGNFPYYLLYYLSYILLVLHLNVFYAFLLFLCASLIFYSICLGIAPFRYFFCRYFPFAPRPCPLLLPLLLLLLVLAVLFAASLFLAFRSFPAFFILLLL